MKSDPKVARDITPELLGRYLTARGWTLRPFPTRKLSLYVLESDDDEPVEIVVPASYVSSASAAIQDALLTLSQVMDRPVEEVAHDVRAVAFDIIRNRVPDEYVKDDAIDLGLAEEFVKGMRQLLTSSATTELNPVPSYVKATNAAADFAGRCRFGHTFRGSFGFVVELPVGLNLEPTMPGFEDQGTPFARRVIQRLARGLRTMDQAASADDPSLLIQHFTGGLSANMCDDIADILEETGVSNLNVGIEYSPEWPVAADLLPSPEFILRRSHVDLLRSAAVAMRAEPPTPDVVVTGRIKELETDGNPADLLEESARKVVVNWQAPDGGMTRVHVVLSPADYLRAVDAHKEGRLVSIMGTLRRGKKTYQLDLPRDLVVLP